MSVENPSLIGLVFVAVVIPFGLIAALIFDIESDDGDGGSDDSPGLLALMAATLNRALGSSEARLRPAG
ncbi:MAG: hypothetical protein AAFR02_07140 [Pseudomonadota bacterium]